MKRLFLGILAICWVIGVKAQEVFSPDGKINVRFFLSEKVSLIIQVTDGLLPMILAMDDLFRLFTITPIGIVK